MSEYYLRLHWEDEWFRLPFLLKKRTFQFYSSNILISLKLLQLTEFSKIQFLKKMYRL